MLQFNHFKGRCKPMDKRTSTNGNKVLGYIAKRIAVRDANTTCPFLGYQEALFRYLQIQLHLTLLYRVILFLKDR